MNDRQKIIKLALPKLGFGFMRLPVQEDRIDFEAVNLMVDRYMASGQNYFDTAYFYHSGQSEEAIRKCVVDRYPRDRFYVADKLPVWSVEKEGNQHIFDTQLKRCGVDYFDFYLMHAVDDNSYDKIVNFECLEFIAEQKKAGRVRFMGFSFHGSAPFLDRFLTEHPEMDFVQIQLSYYDMYNTDLAEHYEVAHRHDLPLLIMEPLRGGMLARLPQPVLEVLEGQNPDVSPASWALRYVAGLPGVATVLSGMSTVGQIEDNVNHTTPLVPLNDIEQDTVKQAAAVLADCPTTLCTGCKYCAGCPAGIPIDTIFSIYDEYGRSKDLGKMFKRYAEIPAESQADCCTECGQCVTACPQGLDVPAKLKEVTRLLG